MSIFFLIGTKKRRRKIKEKVKNIFLVMRTVRIKSLINVPIYHKTVLAIVIILYIISLVLNYLFWGGVFEKKLLLYFFDVWLLLLFLTEPPRHTYLLLIEV